MRKNQKIFLSSSPEEFLTVKKTTAPRMSPNAVPKPILPNAEPMAIPNTNPSPIHIGFPSSFIKAAGGT